MKKYLLLLLLLLLFPFAVNADAYTIKTKVGVEGKTLEEGEFVFNLKDDQGNIIQTKKNDKDGNVVFDSIEWNENGITTWKRGETGKFVTVNNLFKIYTIEQDNNGIKGYTFDTEKTYVQVTDEGKKVTYLKYPSDERIKAETPHYEWKPFHATDDQLQGTVYVEYDLDNDVVRVFRDEPNKYTVKQRIDNKIYSILDENSEHGTIYSVVYNMFDNNTGMQYIRNIKKVIIEDPIRPYTGNYMFGQFESLEKIEGMENLDTSKMISMNYMFTGLKKIKELDLTHFDFSGITVQNGVNNFVNTYWTDETEGLELKIAGFNLPEGVDTYDMFIFTANNGFLPVKTNMQFLNNDNLKNIVNSDGIIRNFTSMNFRYLFRNSYMKYADYSGFRIHIYNDKTVPAPARYGGLGEMFNINAAYYFDISGITTDLCAYASSDIRIDLDTLRILKISDRNSSTHGLVHPNDYDPHYMYNVDNNIMSAELNEFSGGHNYLISNPDSYSYDDCDRYYHGGTWLNIADNSAEYLNSYVKPEVKGVEENPKTGIIKYTIFIIAILALSIYFFNKTRKQTYFNN